MFCIRPILSPSRPLVSYVINTHNANIFYNVNITHSAHLDTNWRLLGQSLVSTSIRTSV